MHDLIELVGSLPWGKLKSTPMWDTIFEPGSHMARLFDILYENQAATDEEAAILVYGSPKSMSKLLSLKNKMKERLLDVVFLLDFSKPAYTDRQKAYFECNKRLATGSTLLAQRATLSAIGQMEQLYRHAQFFEFTDLCVSALYHLRLHYGTIVGDSKKYELYRKQYQHYQSVWMKENEAEELYTQLISRFVSNRAPKEDVAREAATYFSQIEPHLATCSSFRLHLCGRLLQLMAHSSRNDYHAVADLCEQAIEFFRQKPYDSHLPMQAFYCEWVVSSVQLRNFALGQSIIRQQGHFYPEGSFNWFKMQELYFLLSLHTQHYDDAYDTCEQALQHASFSKQPAQITEMWKIYEAYTQLLIRIRRVDRMPAKKFRPAKFLNDIPVFSKDKRGVNIPVLIVQILFDIVDKRYDACIERVEAIQKYASRYLKKEEHFRSNCLLKMLVQIPEAAFHREAVARKTARYLEQMQEMPIEIANQPHEIEIIPYEDLWSMILDILPQKRMYG